MLFVGRFTFFVSRALRTCSCNLRSKRATLFFRVRSTVFAVFPNLRRNACRFVSEFIVPRTLLNSSFVIFFMRDKKLEEEIPSKEFAVAS